MAFARFAGQRDQVGDMGVNPGCTGWFLVLHQVEDRLAFGGGAGGVQPGKHGL